MVSKLVAQFAALLSLVLFSSASPSAAAILNAVVEDDELSARVFFLGLVDAQVTVSFEDAEGLSLQSLGLSAQLVSLLNPSFTARLPQGVSSLSVLPIKLVIDPPENGGLSFRGLPEVSLGARLLSLPIGAPLRMVSARPGEPFQDSTASDDEWEGSYRVGGSDPKFAGEYVFVLDHRLVNEVVLHKLVRLEDVLEEHQTLIDPPVRIELSDRIVEIRQEIEDGHIGQALLQLDAFLLVIREESGLSIPDRWRAARDLVNVAGELRSISGALLYSLERAE